MPRKPFISALCSLSLGLFLSGSALAQPAPGTSTTTTTSTTTSTTVPAAKKKVSAPVKKTTAPAAKVEETSTISTTTTTTPPPPAPPAPPRTVYDQDALKKLSEANKLCVEGFKAYVGTETKNVCNSTANPPDLAYTCAWDKDGPPAFPPSQQGPCTLDFTDHRGEVVITRDKWKDNPPMKYGSKAQCCFRASK